MKSYTDLAQSKKLTEILPIESADVYYTPPLIKGHTDYIPHIKRKLPIDWDVEQAIPCWSLAALLEQLDSEITDEEGNDYNLTIVKESLKYYLYYHDPWEQAEDIEADCYDNMIDACYEMILKLNELKLL